jgi:hypothetical protein
MGRCPVHGILMSQVDDWLPDENGDEHTIVICPRRDCGILALAWDCSGPYKIHENFAYVIDEAPE